jgi:putative membrane protein
MSIVTIAMALIALIDILIAIVEIFFWKNPVIHERLGFPPDIAIQAAPIIQNTGLYNSFIAADLLWSAFSEKNALPLRSFFLTCVAIAGIFGVVTLPPTTLAL